MKKEKKNIEFIKQPSSFTKDEMSNIKGGKLSSTPGCIGKCGTNTGSTESTSILRAN